MKKTTRFLFCLSVLCVSALISPPSWAQPAKGQYVPAPVTPPEEGLPPTVPRVFSSQVSSVKQAEKLDLKYYTLTTMLNGFAETDHSYRARLMEQLEPFKFQVTRRKEEFAKDIKDAKSALEDNYKKYKTAVADFEKDLGEQQKTFPAADQDALKKAGAQALKTYKGKSEEYFKLQAKFIKTYSQLVRFILSHGGSYYYDSGRKAVAFYNAGEANTFVKMYDELNMINFNQKQIMKTFTAGPPL